MGSVSKARQKYEGAVTSRLSMSGSIDMARYRISCPLHFPWNSQTVIWLMATAPSLVLLTRSWAGRTLQSNWDILLAGAMGYEEAASQEHWEEDMVRTSSRTRGWQHPLDWNLLSSGVISRPLDHMDFKTETGKIMIVNWPARSPCRDYICPWREYPLRLIAVPVDTPLNSFLNGRT